MILEARNLSFGYGNQVVGHGLDVQVATGEVVALLGPNGGGKTTLLKRCLASWRRWQARYALMIAPCMLSRYASARGCWRMFPRCTREHSLSRCAMSY